jgi:hypothetical protein
MERVRSLGTGRVEDPRRGRRKLQRGRNPGEYRPTGERKLEPVANGLAGGIEASKRVKPAERAVLRGETQGDREARFGA